ncbi:MAG: hypothetical protein WC538_11515 [Thermoanaerobaculia bacterium]|jgi:hypothetical protein
MTRRLAVVMLASLMLVTRAVSAAGDAESLADESLPAVSAIATKVARATWSARVDELMGSAPLSVKPSAAWKKSDPHWDAARDAMMKRIDAWAAAVVADAAAMEIVRHKFATLDAAKTETMHEALEASGTKAYPAVCDAVHLGVLFAEQNPDLKIGTAAFTKAYESWRVGLGLATSQPTMTPKLTALLESDAGSAYRTARGAAIDAIVTRLDDQIQLEFYDAQQSILSSIDAKAKECAMAKHRK